MLTVSFRYDVLHISCVHSARTVASALGSLYPKSGKLDDSVEED